MGVKTCCRQSVRCLHWYLLYKQNVGEVKKKINKMYERIEKNRRTATYAAVRLKLIPSADAVVLNDVVHVLVASAGEVDEDRTVGQSLGQLNAVSNGVGTFDGRDDAFHTS